MTDIPEGFPDPYVPKPLPPKDIELSDHFEDILKATEAISRYDGILHNTVNPSLILAPLTSREAVLSSKIEGTIATLEEVMIYGVQPLLSDKEVRNEVKEVYNYILAMRRAITELNKRPLSIRMICDLHRTLLTGVRGADKRPGEIRTSQNLVRTEYGRFTPPAPQLVPDFLDKWATYLHKKEANWLVQLAVLKAQFELIHPFRDGNGRIGRMLVPLILYNKKHIMTPTFYVSDYLDKNRDAYFESLVGISKNDDWNSWIKFFLNAITVQSEANSTKVIAINRLYNEMKVIIPDVAPSKHSVQVIDTLFSNPYFDTSYFVVQSRIPRARAHELLVALTEKEILTVLQHGAGSRSTLYAFPKLFTIINDTDV
jgi:Fic family protein